MTSIERNHIVELTRSWIGTPYHHQAAMKGVGCDCLGLVRGLWRELYQCDAPSPPPYSRDWGDVDSGERLLTAGDEYLLSVPLETIQVGDVFALRWRSSKSAKHLAILVEPGRFVHSYEKAGVVEVSLSRHWRAMMVRAWSFP